jgi:hypothetical protein
MQFEDQSWINHFPEIAITSLLSVDDSILVDQHTTIDGSLRECEESISNVSIQNLL